MTPERFEQIRDGVGQLRRRMSVEGVFWLLGWCEELLEEVEIEHKTTPSRPRQRPLFEEDSIVAMS